MDIGRVGVRNSGYGYVDNIEIDPKLVKVTVKWLSDSIPKWMQGVVLK